MPLLALKQLFCILGPISIRFYVFFGGPLINDLETVKSSNRNTLLGVSTAEACSSLHQRQGDIYGAA